MRARICPFVCWISRRQSYDMLAYVQDDSREVASKPRIRRRDLVRLALAAVTAMVTGCTARSGNSAASGPATEIHARLSGFPPYPNADSRGAPPAL